MDKKNLENLALNSSGKMGKSFCKPEKVRDSQKDQRFMTISLLFPESISMLYPHVSFPFGCLKLRFLKSVCYLI